MKLILGDCLEQMALLPSGCVDLILTDLPYGTTQNKWDSVIPLEPLWTPPYFPQGLTLNPRVKSRKSTSVGSGTYGKHNDTNIAEWQGYPTTLIEFKQDGGKVHPTQKPVALMTYLIRTYTNPGQTVLDCTMGSGTTGVACIETGRNFVGIERDPSYFKIAQERIAATEDLFSYQRPNSIEAK